MIQSHSEVWKHHKTALKQLLTDGIQETSVSLALHTILQKPIREHVQQYSLILTRLSEATGKVLTIACWDSLIPELWGFDNKDDLHLHRNTY